jgi:hypothetical protein
VSGALGKWADLISGRPRTGTARAASSWREESEKSEGANKMAQSFGRLVQERMTKIAHQAEALDDITVLVEHNSFAGGFCVSLVEFGRKQKMSLRKVIF